MAEAATNRFIHSGYDEDFVVPPDEDLHCIICQLPSKGPVLTRCGHRFCRECLEEYLRRQEQEGCQLTCPIDREVLERNKDIFPNKFIERKILSLLIKCPSEGCEWNGELRAKEDHLASCIFKDVSCTNENCEVIVARKDLTEHVTTTCQWRIVKCDYCGEHHPQCQMEIHLETCEGFLIACPNKCGTRIASTMIPNHVENNCPLTIVPCSYTWIGCNSEIRREELESHLQCEIRHHLELACCKLSNIQDEVKEKAKKLNSLEEKVTSIQRQYQKKVSNLQNQLEEREKLLENQLEERVKVHENQLEERVKDHENQLEERVKVLENQLEERVNIQTRINEGLNQNNNKVKKELNTYRWALFFCFAVVFVIVGVLLGLANRVKVVQSHSETKIEKAEKSFEEQVNNVQSKLELAVDDLQKKTDSLLNNALGDKTFTWKIESFEYVLTQAKSGSKIQIESEPFYMYGYKLKLQLCPNGLAGGQNTHLSLFLTVMKGEYDAILDWPFQKNIKFTLKDQQENPAERKNVIRGFDPNPTHIESFGKPITSENKFGRGFGTFVSHEELRTRRFVVDDVIFIQIQLGP